MSNAVSILVLATKCAPRYVPCCQIRCLILKSVYIAPFGWALQTHWYKYENIYSYLVFALMIEQIALISPHERQEGR